MQERLLRVLPALANADGEFAIAARLWNADVLFVSGDDAVLATVRDGVVSSAAPSTPDAPAPVRIVGPADGWEKLLMRKPPPFYQDLFGAATRHGFLLLGLPEEIFPYYAALRRIIELAREV